MGLVRGAGGFLTVYGGSSLNLGWTKEDEAALVAENRRRFVRAVGGEDRLTLVGVRQVHSDTVWVLGEGDGALEGKIADCRREGGAGGRWVDDRCSRGVDGGGDCGLRSGAGGGSGRRGRWGRFMRGGEGPWQGSLRMGLRGW